MTEREMRELDAWIAEHIFGVEVKRDANGEPYNADGVLHGTIISWIPHYTRDPEPFSAVKREIEQRGWTWQIAHNLEGGYDFGIFGPIDSVTGGEETKITRGLAIKHAKTEELAGCLALREAVE